MNRTVFLKALGSRLFPILRAEGFRGSGSTLRRINDPVVHVFNVQGSSRGKECYLNLGAHLLFLPTAGDGQAIAKSLKEYECVFRGRFDPPAGLQFGWNYAQTREDMDETISFICDHWSIYGHEFFDRFAEYPQSFLKLVEEADETKKHPIDLLDLARIAVHLGETSRAVVLANEGLRRCPERATGLKKKLEEILDRL